VVGDTRNYNLISGDTVVTTDVLMDRMGISVFGKIVDSLKSSCESFRGGLQHV